MAVEKVKSGEILAYAKEHGSEIDVEIVDDDDLYPFITSVEVEADPDNHKCTLSGYYTYREDSPRYGLSFGSCEFTILGVKFSTPYDDHTDFETSGKTVDYGEMDEDEFWEQLQEMVDIPTYDSWDGGYDFDESGVTDEDIKDNLESSYSVYAIDGDGEVCAFDSEDDIPEPDPDDEDAESSYEIIDEDDAFVQLAVDRPGLSFSQR